MEWGDFVKSRLERINFLSQKARTEGLTNAEKVEQQVLREDHLREIRGQVIQTVSSISVQDFEGNDVTPEKVKKLKATIYGIE